VLSELGWSITAMAAPPADIVGYQLAVLDIALDPVVARNRDGLELTWQVTARHRPCVVLSALKMMTRHADRSNSRPCARLHSQDCSSAATSSSTSCGRSVRPPSWKRRTC
jgi:hypothetical protein